MWLVKFVSVIHNLLYPRRKCANVSKFVGRKIIVPVYPCSSDFTYVHLQTGDYNFNQNTNTTVIGIRSNNTRIKICLSIIRTHDRFKFVFRQAIYYMRCRYIWTVWVSWVIRMKYPRHRPEDTPQFLVGKALSIRFLEFGEIADPTIAWTTVNEWRTGWRLRRRTGVEPTISRAARCIKAENVDINDGFIPDESIQGISTPFPDGIPGRPIGDTRRAFRSRRADFPARLCGLAAVCRVRFVRQTKKIPDAVFSGDIAALGRGFCAEVGHFPSAVIAAFGG